MFLSYGPDLSRRRIAEKGLKPEVYKHYLDLRRFGGVPHSGYVIISSLVLCCGGVTDFFNNSM